MASESRITGNFFVCKNEVFVEGKSIGNFSSLETESDRKNLTATATVEMPFYSVAVAAAKEVSSSSVVVREVGDYATTYVRINPDDWNIRIGARIRIYTWYEDNEQLGHKFDKVLEFDGFIRHIEGGFPTVLKCEDAAFMLRFGTVNKTYGTPTKLVSLLQEMCDISNEAFAKYRRDNGLTAEIPKLEPDGKTMDTDFILKPAASVSPYDVIERVVIGMYKLYGAVRETYDDAGKSVAYVYAGLGISDPEAPTRKLSTAVNVVGRSIVPNDHLFENFNVTVRWIEGKELKSYSTGTENGIPYEIPYTPGRTAEQMKTTAKSALAGLKANRNKGTITTLLYPTVSLFDYVDYEDTIYTTLSGRYYVIGRRLTCGKGRGYYQTITVTNSTFLYLG